MINFYWLSKNFKFKFLLKPLWHLIDSYNPFMAKKVDKIIEIEKPDVIKCHNLAGFSNAVWKIAKNRGIPLIQILHDTYSLCVKSTMYNGKNNCKKQCLICKLYRFRNEELSNNVDIVIGVSSFVLKRHLEYDLFKNSKKFIIHNGVEIDSEHLKKYEDNNRKIVAGFIGAISPHKGIEFLLESFSKLDENILNNSVLLIAGSGNNDYVENLKRKYNFKNIIFLGFIKNMDFYKKIDVLIVSSLWNDTFPTVVLESISNGIPVIASKRGGIPEIIVDGYNGFLFEPNNNGEFESCVENIYKNRDLLIKLSKNAIESSKKYDKKIMIGNYAKILRGLI